MNSKTQFFSSIAQFSASALRGATTRRKIGSGFTNSLDEVSRVALENTRDLAFSLGDQRSIPGCYVMN